MCGHFLCRLNDIPDGESRGFDPLRSGQDTVLAIRRGATLHVYRDACPHHGTTHMAWRKDAYLNAQRDRIVCSAHGAQFDIETGACTLGPCLGQSLTALPYTLNERGEIYLTTDPNLESLP
jgi:nitrite reductase/ring-hydroxylating ferredoxin subunit